MSDAFLRVLNAPTGDDIAVARMWEQYDFDASEWDADRGAKPTATLRLNTTGKAITMTTKTGTC